MQKMLLIVVKLMLIHTVAKEKPNFVSFGLFVSMLLAVQKAFVTENLFMDWQRQILN
jgi:hypothetical protein